METEGAGILLFPRPRARGCPNRVDRKPLTSNSGQRHVDEALDEGCLDIKSEVHSHSISVHPTSLSLHSTPPPSLSAEQCHNVAIETQHRRRRRRGACGRRERILHLYQRDVGTMLHRHSRRGSRQPSKNDVNDVDDK